MSQATKTLRLSRPGGTFLELRARNNARLDWRIGYSPENSGPYGDTIGIGTPALAFITAGALHIGDCFFYLSPDEVDQVNELLSSSPPAPTPTTAAAHHATHADSGPEAEAPGSNPTEGDQS